MDMDLNLHISFDKLCRIWQEINYRRNTRGR